MPEIGHDLTAEQELACALRILAGAGWQENLSGHITVAIDSDHVLVNPWGLWWQEVRASDIITVRLDGGITNGKWDITPAVYLHTELHRARPDATVVIHNHPFHATLLACLGMLPTISHQNSALFHNEMVYVDEYAGTVESVSAGAALAHAVGNATTALLANHGAIVTGETIGAACYRAVTFERACAFETGAMQAGRQLRPLPGAGITALQSELKRNTSTAFWNGAVRQLLATNPEVLT